MSTIMKLLSLCILNYFTVVAIAHANEESAVPEKLLVEAKLKLNDKKYSEILSDKNHPVDARIIDLLTLVNNKSNNVQEIYTRLALNHESYNVAEQYLMLLIKAKLVLDTKKLEQVSTWLNQALSYSDKIDENQLALPIFADAHIMLADNYAANGQYELAYDQKVKFLNKYRKHRYNVRNKKQQELNKKYETDIKIKKTALLESEKAVKDLEIKKLLSEQEAQQRNTFILVATVVIFIILLLRQVNILFKLKRLSQRDALTKLYNRKEIFKLSNEQVQFSKKEHKSFSAILIDIDSLHSVNEKYGYLLGDKALIAIAKLGLESLRSRDLFARIAGEEFLAVLPDASIDEAKAIAERFREKIALLRLEDKPELVLSASMGVAEISSSTGSFEQLLTQVDHAMLSAKDKGHNKVCCYES